jgi:hypothetical protein
MKIVRYFVLEILVADKSSLREQCLKGLTSTVLRVEMVKSTAQ